MSEGEYAIGYPAYAMVDTCILVALRFDYRHPSLMRLQERASKGHIHLLVPTVTLGEYKAKIKSQVREAKKSYRQFKKDSHILRSLSPTYDALLLEPDWNAVEAKSLAALDAFLTKCNGTHLEPASAAAKDVLAAYFDGKEPFGQQLNKNGFPDAFAVHALDQFAHERSQAVLIVSHDDDMRRAAEQYGELIYLPNVDELLQTSLDEPPFPVQELRKFLTQHESAISTQVTTAVVGKEIWWYPDEYYDLEVSEIIDADVRAINLVVVGGDTDHADVTGFALTDITANATFANPDLLHWDSEDDTVIAGGYKRVRLSAIADVHFTFSLKMDKYRAGVLELTDLIINEDDGIEIQDPEMEDLGSSELRAGNPG